MQTGFTSDFTDDQLLGGRLHLRQPTTGPRCTSDTLWLASFPVGDSRRLPRIVDLGAGVGSLGLAYHVLRGSRLLTLVEKFQGLATFASWNLRRAGAAGEVLRRDVSDGATAAMVGSADLVLCNPPFFEPGSGRPPATEQRTGARHGRLEPFLDMATQVLADGGAACVVYRAAGLPLLLGLASARGLVPRRLRFVHATASECARIALVELRRGGPTTELVVEPPAWEWDANGVPSAEFQSLR